MAGSLMLTAPAFALEILLYGAVAITFIALTLFLGGGPWLRY